MKWVLTQVQPYCRRDAMFMARATLLDQTELESP